jgi:hypothetical protein
MANLLKLTVNCGYETLIETTDPKLISATLFQYYHNTPQATLDAAKVAELMEEINSKNSSVNYWEKEAHNYKKQLAELKAKLEEVNK